MPADAGARHAAAVREFKRAWEAKDIHALIALLDPDATATADGGGLVAAQLQPLEGRERVAHACVGLAERAPGLVLLERAVNGQPGLVVQLAGATEAVLAFDVAGDLIKRLWAVRNPEKLRSWTSR